MNRLQTQEKKKSGCLPLAGGDESFTHWRALSLVMFAPRMRG